VGDVVRELRVAAATRRLRDEESQKGDAIMSWFEKFRMRMQIFSIVFAVVCPSLLITMALGSKQQISSYQWPEVEGTVVALVPKSSDDGERGTKYRGRVAYKYEVAGKSYASDLTAFFPGWQRSDQATALADVSQYDRGDKVAVYYDPNNPAVGVLEKGIPQVDQILYIVLSVLCLVSVTGAVFTVRSWLRAWRLRSRGSSGVRTAV
jgi:hypothetical protein